MVIAEELLSEHPLCRVCGEKADTVRKKGNPWWGLDENHNPRKTIDDWLPEANPDDVDGVCWTHLEWARDGKGGYIDPARKSGPGTGNWMVRKKTEQKQARIDLIEALGGVCNRCNHEVPYGQLRILVPGHSRHNYDISTKTEWWEFVRITPVLLELAETQCIDCVSASTLNVSRSRDAREQVVEAYGNRCWYNSCNRTESLMVAAMPDTPALRWPNGDKYNTHAKLKYLIRNSFPSGWTVTCGAHLHLLQGSSTNP
jgi:hypothetical protein